MDTCCEYLFEKCLNLNLYFYNVLSNVLILDEKYIPTQSFEKFNFSRICFLKCFTRYCV